MIRRGLGLTSQYCVDSQTGRGEGLRPAARRSPSVRGLAPGVVDPQVDVEAASSGALAAGLDDGQDAFTGVGGDVGTGDVVVWTGGIRSRGTTCCRVPGRNVSAVSVVQDSRSSLQPPTGRRFSTVKVVADPQCRVEPLVVGGGEPGC